MDSQKRKVDLVLEGGGVKGLGLVGAITELADSGYSFQRTAGTSAGAIIGSFVAAGCTPEKMVQIMQSVDYKRFKDETILSRLGSVGKIASLLLESGIYKGDYLAEWLAGQLKDCGISTFGDLKLSGAEYAHLPKNQAYRLVVITSDLSKGELVYLPWDYPKYGLDPDKQTIASAVRTSMSIPFFFKPAHIAGDTFVDGGYLSNFPVDAFDEPSNAQPEWPTFGIKLSSRENAGLVPRKITGPLSLASALFSTATNGHDQRHLNDPATLARTIFVDTGTIQVTNFDITRAEQDYLYQNGQKAAKKFLTTWEYAAFRKEFLH